MHNSISSTLSSKRVPREPAYTQPQRNAILDWNHQVFARQQTTVPSGTTSATTPLTTNADGPEESEEARMARLLDYFKILEPGYAIQFYDRNPSKTARLSRSVYENIIRHPGENLAALKAINAGADRVEPSHFSIILNNSMQHFAFGMGIMGDKDRAIALLNASNSYAISRRMTGIRISRMFQDSRFNSDAMIAFFIATAQYANSHRIRLDRMKGEDPRPVFQAALDYVPANQRADVRDMLYQETDYARLLPHSEGQFKGEVLTEAPASGTGRTPATSGTKRKHSDDDDSPVTIDRFHTDRTNPPRTAASEFATHNSMHPFLSFPPTVSWRMRTAPLAPAVQTQLTAPPPHLDELLMLLSGGDPFPDLELNANGDLVPSGDCLRLMGQTAASHNAPTFWPNPMGSSTALPPSFVASQPQLAANMPLGPCAEELTTSQQQEEQVVLAFLEDHYNQLPLEELPVPGTLGQHRSLRGELPHDANAIGPPDHRVGFSVAAQGFGGSTLANRDVVPTAVVRNPMLDSSLPGGNTPLDLTSPDAT